MLDNNSSLAFYEKTWFMVLMMLFIPPVGILLLWKFKDWNKTLKSIVTVPLAVWSLLFIFTAFGPAKVEDTPDALAVKDEVGLEETPEPVEDVVEETPTPTVEPTPQPKPSPKPSASVSSVAWYEGGTLHDKKISDWKEATHENKLATCADIIAGSRDNLNLDITTVDSIKPFAEDLIICIDTAVEDLDEMDSQDVAYLAVLSMIVLEWTN